MRALLTEWPNLTLARWAILVALSLILPVSIFFGRGNIRKRRLAALHDLETKAFKHVKERDGLTLPYLDLVRARYEQAGPNGAAGAWALVRGYLAEVAAYLLPTSIFVILTALGIYLTLSAMHYGFKDPNLLILGLSNPDNATGYQATTALIVSAAFLGAYVWSINYLILRVANFDLTPLDFLRVSAHLLLTTMLALVFRHFAASASLDIMLGVVLLTAFMMGMIPSLGLNVLIDRLPPSLRIKRVVPEAKEIGREFPLDLIDGIDTGIKFRLANYEINDAQNIATENPIGLYVATPYNLLEIMDWMAQAQLLITLGPARYLEARGKSIRDIHGLLAFGTTPEGSAILSKLFFGEAMPEALVQARLASIAADLHVDRLAHLRDTIAASMQAPPRPALRVVGA
jgi:hypothetical protein